MRPFKLARWSGMRRLGSIWRQILKRPRASSSSAIIAEDLQSECSLEHIKAIATGCKITVVTLLTVIEEPQFSYGGYTSQQAIEEKTKQRENEMYQIQKGAEDYLTRAAEDLRKENITVHTDVIQSSINHGAADAILDYARNNKVDLIIMSTHGRSGISRLAFGSITDKVIRHAKIPVLTIIPEGCRD